jgi:adenylate kinase
MLRMIPVAVITGPVGVGKSAVLREADALLVRGGVAHATIELEDIARFWGPQASESRTRPDVAYRNLASLWANYNAAGADRLLLSLLMDRHSDLDLVREAIPSASITVVQLHASLSVIEERLRLRENTIPEQELTAARWWVTRLQGSTFADYVVDNGDRSPSEVATDVLRALGWLNG